MHHYRLRQKFFALGDDYRITDDSGRDVYRVDGRAFSWGDKLSLQEAASGRELAFISQKLFSRRPHYQLFRDGRLFAEITKEFSWANTVFSLNVPGPNDYQIKGDFFDREYEFHRDTRIVARVSRRAWSLTDTYGIDIVEQEDDVAVLATAVVVDLVCHENESQRKGD